MLPVTFLFIISSLCINGEDVLMPVKAHVHDWKNMGNSSLVAKLIQNPKALVQELASADPGTVNDVIVILQGLVSTGTNQINAFIQDEADALLDKNNKQAFRDGLNGEVILLTSQLAGKTADLGVAQGELDAANTHHAAMLAEKETNVPVLENENQVINDAIALLQGLLGGPAPPAASGDNYVVGAQGSGTCPVGTVITSLSDCKNACGFLGFPEGDMADGNQCYKDYFGTCLQNGMPGSGAYMICSTA